MSESVKQVACELYVYPQQQSPAAWYSTTVHTFAFIIGDVCTYFSLDNVQIKNALK